MEQGRRNGSSRSSAGIGRKHPVAESGINLYEGGETALDRQVEKRTEERATAVGTHADEETKEKGDVQHGSDYGTKK